MISIRKIIWLIALILLLLAIPFLVPSSLIPMNTDAEVEAAGFYTMEDLPHFEHVDLENPNPEPLALGDKGPYAPKADHYLPDRGGYVDSTTYIQVEERKIRNTLIYFTYIQIADPSQMKTATYKPYPSTAAALSNKIAKGRNTIVAMNGDWFANKDNKGRGTIYRNGEFLREKESGIYDALIIDMQGDFHIIPHAVPEDFAPYEGNIMHSFCFPCALVIDGEVMPFDKKDPDTDSLLAHHIEGWKHAQRSVFCQLDHLTYLIITSEGPDQSKGGGLTIPEIAQLACDMGAQQAFNLDGGSSAALLLEGTRVNCTKTPLPNPRQIGDIIFFVTAEP